MRKSYLFAGIGLFAAAVACGGDDGGSHESSEVQTLCARICVRAKGPACAGDSPATCMSTCTAQAAAAPAACSPQLDTLLTCASKAAFTCDADKQAQPQGCDAQLSALSSCLPPLASKDASVPVASRDSGVSPLSDAALPGSDGGLFTDAGPLGDAGDTPLACAPDKGDEACSACGKGKCCQEFATCVGSSGCAQVGACVSDCADGDDACLTACEDANPAAAVSQFLDLLDCSTDLCFTECS